MKYPLLQRTLFSFLVAFAFFYLKVPPLQAKTLEGKIEHSESMPSVDDQFSKGRLFDEQALKNLYPQRLNFFQVPEWYVGTWEKTQDTCLYFYDYATNAELKNREGTHKSYNSRTFGSLRDEHGTYWQRDDTPYYTVVTTDKTIAYVVLQEWYPIQSATDHMTFRGVDLKINVDRATNKILDTVHEENISTYFPVDRSTIRRDLSTRVFNQDGRPDTDLKDSTLEHKTAELAQPTDPSIFKDLQTFLQHLPNQ